MAIEVSHKITTVRTVMLLIFLSEVLCSRLTKKQWWGKTLIYSGDDCFKSTQYKLIKFKEDD